MPTYPLAIVRIGRPLNPLGHPHAKRAQVESLKAANLREVKEMREKFLRSEKETLELLSSSTIRALHKEKDILAQEKDILQQELSV